jgi:uncharacterized protein YutE (UPF0331/DUF86 family)
MAEDNKLFSFIDSKVVYLLSFLLIIFTLKDTILSFFSEGIEFEILWFNVSPDKFLSTIVLLQFLSIYFYGINYVIKDPLNKAKRAMNWIASILWFISFLSPFYLLLILIAESLFSEGIILTIVSLTFVASAIFISIWSEKKDRELDSMELEEEIEKLKTEPAAGDNVAEFLRYYQILDSIIKNAIVEKMNISIDEDEAINLSGASNILHGSTWINADTREKIKKMESVRNKVIHEEYRVSEKEIEQIKDMIKDFDEDIKRGKGR